MTTTELPIELSEANERRPNALVRLYRGETSFDFVGRRRIWYLVSLVVIAAGLASLGVRGLNLGIDFRGGTAWEVTAPGLSASKVTRTLQAEGVSQPVVQILGGRTVDAQADLNKLPAATRSRIETNVQAALGRLAHVPASQVSLDEVGPTWGGQVTKKAVIALIVFFVLIVAYISVRFEWKMALAALVAVVHDLLVTAGVYSLTGLQVTPDTVIAILTILGYSLYDTVVVFDRVGENTKGLGASGRMTYEDVVNLSMNQVLARSVNTSLVAILPVLSVLLIGAELLGATTLQEFGLALVIGLTSGAYSSIFIASPLLAQMKEREPRYASIRQKLANRADRSGLLTPKAAAMLTTTASGQGSQRSGGSKARGTSRPVARSSGTTARAGRIVPKERPHAGELPSRSASGEADGYLSAANGVSDGTEAPEGSGLLPGNGSQAPGGAPSRAEGNGAAGARAGGRTAGAARRPPKRGRKSSKPRGQNKGGKRR